MSAAAYSAVTVTLKTSRTPVINHLHQARCRNRAGSPAALAAVGLTVRPRAGDLVMPFLIMFPPMLSHAGRASVRAEQKRRCSRQRTTCCSRAGEGLVVTRLPRVRQDPADTGQMGLVPVPICCAPMAVLVCESHTYQDVTRSRTGG